MAELVGVFLTPHDPTLPGWVGDPPWPFVAEAAAFMEGQRRLLAAAAPDVLIAVGSDHFSQFFLDNMPAFLVGKPERVRGPFPDEQRIFGLGSYDVPCDRGLAKALLRGGMARGVDFAASDDLIVDHAFTIPLNFLRPEQDLPVVPVFTNVMAPPLPSGRRFYEVGEAIREAIWEYEPAESLRVAVIATGHMSNAVGSPGGMRPDSAWDAEMWELITSAEVEPLLAAATFERLVVHGSNTMGFLNICLARGVAGGVPATRSLMMSNPQGPGAPLLEWDQAVLARMRAQRGESGVAV